jgi:two-component system chemotaxis response regulator CheB
VAEKIKVLVVDDASFMIKAVSDILNSDPDIEVVGTAKNGVQALEKIKELSPDVVTLDVDMPIMDGIRTVRHIMLECPVPVIMLSSLFNNGAITFEALRLGVVDFLPKPSGAISQDIHKAKQQILDRIKIAVAVNMNNIHRVRIRPSDEVNKMKDYYSFQTLDHILLMGTTLGGPNTCMRIFSDLPPRLSTAAVVVQEISTRILPAFVSEFNKYTPWRICEALDGTVLEAGVCYVASNESLVTITVNSNQEACLRVEGHVEEPLNQLFSSAANVFARNTIGVLLTGIGNDGADGFFKIKQKLGITIAQKSDTCVYPNLAACAIERGVVDVVVEETQLAHEIEILINEQASTLS